MLRREHPAGRKARYLQNRILPNAMGIVARLGGIVQPDRLPMRRKQSKAHRERVDPGFHSEIAVHTAFSGGAHRSTPCGIAD